MSDSPEPLVAVLDANVLYPQFLRDVLLRLAGVGLFAPRWTERIQREWARNLAAVRPDLWPEKIQRVQRLMDASFPHALVVGYRSAERAFAGVHSKDRHVAAAALRGGASHIVTWNLRDFPAEALAPFGVVATDPDAFVTAVMTRFPSAASDVLERHRTALTRPHHTHAEYREAFRRAGLMQSASRLPHA